MRSIPLTGKYAIGKFKKALVDDEDYETLSQFSWKAKPNQNKTHIYAVRNIRQNGKCIMLRMHRVVLGISYDGKLDIDHINRNSVDNQRQNLRLVSRSDNIKNTTQEIKIQRRQQAKLAAEISNQLRKEKAEPKFVLIEFNICLQCEKAFRKKKRIHNFCSEHCRKRWHHYYR